MVNKDIENTEDEFTTEPETHNHTNESEIVDDEATSKDLIKQLRNKVRDLTEEKQAIHEDLQRIKAEYLNARKRLESDTEQKINREKINFIVNLLPLCDSFQMAMSDTEVWNAVDEKWRRGIEGIHTQLQSILKQHSVESVSPLHEPFDPALHEAISEEEVKDEEQHNRIQQVIQLGYQLKNDSETVCIRPARVVVGSYNE